MGTLVNRIPWEISGRGSGSQGQYIPTDLDFDYAIGGIPFVSAIKDEFPYTERMAPIRKDQFDSFAEPGEQSLQGWWLRSQSTFTGGAGVLYQDPDNDNQFNYKFADSLGVDPWDSGDLKLLRRSINITSTAVSVVLAQGYVDPSGVDSCWLVQNTDLTKQTDSGSTNISVGGTSILDITSTGATYIIARTNGVWKGLDTAAPTQLYTDALTNPVIEFVKDRLIITNSVNVYQGVLTAAAVALPAASYSHPDPNWRWRSITDGPTAVYIAGDSGTTSQIHKFSVIDNAGVPQFKWAGVTATMPAGEIINTIYSYVESFIGIATNKGFRVGEIDSNGDVAYGPLIFEVSGGARGIVGNDRFMWVGTGDAHDGDSGLYRVDLGNATQEQTSRTVRYAYARDIYAEITSNLVQSVTMFGASNRKVFTIPQFGSYKEAASELLPTGYLTTGRIRFNTEEPKLYKFFSVRTPAPLTGTVAISVLPEGGGEIPYISYSGNSSSGTKDVATPQPVGPQNWLGLKFILGRDPVNNSLGGVLNGWQVKSLPGSIRQRIITVPVLLYDNEKDRAYQSYGYSGYARERLEQFQSLARSGDTWLFQELAEDLVTEVVIDDWEFRQDGPPAPAGALGGVLTMVLRTVAEST
jgi:hypothetical protein